MISVCSIFRIWTIFIIPTIWSVSIIISDPYIPCITCIPSTILLIIIQNGLKLCICDTNTIKQYSIAITRSTLTIDLSLAPWSSIVPILLDTHTPSQIVPLRTLRTSTLERTCLTVCGFFYTCKVLAQTIFVGTSLALTGLGVVVDAAFCLEKALTVLQQIPLVAGGAVTCSIVEGLTLVGDGLAERRWIQEVTSCALSAAFEGRVEFCAVWVGRALGTDTKVQIVTLVAWCTQSTVVPGLTLVIYFYAFSIFIENEPVRTRQTSFSLGIVTLAVQVWWLLLIVVVILWNCTNGSIESIALVAWETCASRGIESVAQVRYLGAYILRVEVEAVRALETNFRSPVVPGTAWVCWLGTLG